MRHHWEDGGEGPRYSIREMRFTLTTTVADHPSLPPCLRLWTSKIQQKLFHSFNAFRRRSTMTTRVLSYTPITEDRRTKNRSRSRTAETKPYWQYACFFIRILAGMLIILFFFSFSYARIYLYCSRNYSCMLRFFLSIYFYVQTPLNGM